MNGKPGRIAADFHRGLRLAAVAALSLMMVFPLYTVAIGGLKTNGQLLSDPFGFPDPPLFDFYMTILGRSGVFWRFLFNSTFVAAGSIALTLFSSMSAALALSRIPFKGRTAVFNFFVMGMLFPITVAILPLYLQLRNFGLLGTRSGVVLAQAAFSLPLSIFIFTGFFRDVPQELQDAVSIDGGGIITFGVRVLLPLSAPVVSTVTVITLIQSWNQFLLPLLVLDNAATFTIPLGVMQFQGQYTSGWNLIMAFIALAMLPMLLFYIFMQKYIVAGLTAGAVKG